MTSAAATPAIEEMPTLADSKEFKAFAAGSGLNLVHFAATWAPACSELNTLIGELKRDLHVDFQAATIDSEEAAQVSLDNDITAVPTVLLFKDGKQVDRIEGFRPSELRTALVKHSFPTGEAPSDLGYTRPTAAPTAVKANGDGAEEGLEERLKNLINRSRLMLFMKGSADAPKCGFSNQIVQLLRGADAVFETFDILGDEEVRQGLKTFSDWPTYPQLYLDGELLGGLDVVREEMHDPEFVQRLPKRG